MNIFKLLKPNQKLSKIIALVILTACVSCSSQDSTFDNEISRLLNSSRDTDINTKRKRLFEKVYSFDKARKEGKDYCQMLASGANKEQLQTKSTEDIMNLIPQGKVSGEEAAYLISLDITIKQAAEKAYCP